MASPASVFDRWSRVYDRPGLQHAVYRPIHAAVIARLRGAEPDVVVDLGCGTGQLAGRLSMRFPDATVVGVDLSAGMLAAARRRAGPAVPLVRADAQRLPIRPASADVVVCTESFHWYPDQEDVLAGLAAVVRSGGRLIIASIASVTDLGASAVLGWSTSAGRTVRAPRPRRVREMVTDAGFEVLHQRRVPRIGPAPWPVLTDARRR